MKQQKLVGYQPKYPKKALRGAALTGLALVAVSGMTGCVKVQLPDVSLQTEGIVAVTEPPEEELVLDGEVAICEPPEEELVLGGAETIPEPTPEMPFQTTGVLLLPTDTPEH